jgi:N-succinyldiaminopimelate aminotransferase
MPRHPQIDPLADELGGSVYSALASRVASLEGEVYPLHIGDTWMEPDPELAPASLGAGGDVRPHRYSDPRGVRSLLGALVDKVRTRNRIAVEGTGNVLVTTGATGALYAAAAASLSRGDEVLVLAPYWPLIRGIVACARAVPVEVPILHRRVDAVAMREALEDRVSSRTAALYVNTPCNPSGWVLDSDVLAAVADFARAHDLWVFADEVYEDYAYLADHISVAAVAPERTLTAFSFSKAYGMAGHRCGYLVGPVGAVSAARRIITYVWYSTPTPSQLLAERALAHGHGWLERARKAYLEVGTMAADRLGLPRPEGSTFLFLDVAHLLDDRGLLGFLDDCLDDNLVLAPGSSFGAFYSTWVRVCYTCVEPERVMRGVDRLAQRLGV